MSLYNAKNEPRRPLGPPVPNDDNTGDRMACGAYQQNDQMVCNKCDLRWDVKDPEPPTCGETLLTREEIHERLLDLSQRMATKPCNNCDISGPDWCEIGLDRGAPCNPISKARR